MNRYLPPAGIDDFSRSQKAEELRQGWHDRTVQELAQIRDETQYPLASPLFYDQLSDTSGVPDSDPKGIPWNGFPLRLQKWYEADAGSAQQELSDRAAEAVLKQAVFGLSDKNGTGVEMPFRVQDEYCEWHVAREGDTIRRISFTCEPPEYWEFLASKDLDLVHALYKELLHRDDIPIETLLFQEDVYSGGQISYPKGSYNPRNRWNTTDGAVHLTHPANSLNAEMILASDGTIGWPTQPDMGGNIGPDSLMCCAGRGGINRSSDPLILSGVFNLARQGLSVALYNPIGLYMAPFDLAGLLDPAGNPVGAQCLNVVRKSSNGQRILRVEVARPVGAGFTLDQCTYNGLPLRYGGQIARDITMRLFGVAKVIPGAKPRKLKTCLTFCCTHPQHP